MRIAVTGSRDYSGIIENVRKRGIEIDGKKPDFVITYGGDGSIIWAENKYPEIPKITIRASHTANRCRYEENALDEILEKLKLKQYYIINEPKIKAFFGKNTAIALNEIQVRSSSFVHALRLSVSVDKEPVFENLIGDGVVVATPFGSTAYYSSVGGQMFDKGIGIALNNPHNHPKNRYLVVDESSEIEISIIREKAVLIFDNFEKAYELGAGEKITIKKAEEHAKFVEIE